MHSSTFVRINVHSIQQNPNKKEMPDSDLRGPALFMVHFDKIIVSYLLRALVCVLWIKPPARISPVVWSLIYCPPNIFHERLWCSRRLVGHDSRATAIWCNWGHKTWGRRHNGGLRSLRLIQEADEDDDSQY